MAVISVPAEKRILHDEPSIRAELSNFGVDYERWDLSRLPEDATAEAVLQIFAAEIDAMKRIGDYTTADVIDVNSATPGLEAMLARFDKEHTHCEDEVRFILSGRGIFFLHAFGKKGESVISVEVGPGDMIRIPRGTTHWFTLCEERRIRAIRWFQNATGWSPEYTASGIDEQYQPLCFGPAYFGKRVETTFGL